MAHNPLNVSLGAQSGTFDQYPVGDLSSKFGQLAGFKVIHTVFNDTNMPLYGPTSVVGRSFVLNRAADNERYELNPEKTNDPSLVRLVLILNFFSFS